MLALQLNLRLTDVEGLIAGRTLAKGTRPTRADAAPARRRVVVVDDSAHTGREMRRVRGQIEAAGLDAEITYAVAFASRRAHAEVDLAAEIVEPPRIFSWNIMHVPEILARTCMDIDGVLCADPAADQNDDGPEYARFISDTPALFLPSAPVKYVVTARLEKYRAATERWLAENRVEYEQLVMMDLEDAEERRRAGSHARHKAEFYAGSDSDLFVESDHRQATEIADRSGRQVFAVDRKEMVYPHPGRALAAAPGPFIRSVGRVPPAQALLWGARERVPEPALKLARRLRRGSSGR
jgi:uncharacterized HAD superfamily protein